MKDFILIAGPCSVESEQQLDIICQEVKKAGVDAIRGGAFKPRTSPYDFQGLGEEGLKLLSEAKAKYNLPIVSEIVDKSQIEMFQDVDILQVGAKNMQNFELLKALGKTDKWILLKRGFGNTVDELLNSAEYIRQGGNEKIILCERGIRSFETSTRFTLDLSAIPVIKSRTNMKVIVDPSHAAGKSQYVRSLALAAVAAGADGLIVEVHNKPKEALCDGKQALSCHEFSKLAHDVFAMRDLMKEF